MSGAGRESSGRRGRRQSGRERAAAAAPRLSPPKQALQDAQTLQQRAERRKGRESIPVYEETVAKFREALELGLQDEEDQQEAHFGLGDALQSYSQAVLDAANSAPDAEQSLQQEKEAKDTALRLLEQAVASYAQVVEGPGGQQRVDAALNSGNSFVAAAEQLEEEPARQEQLLRESLASYAAALQQEEDELTLGNMGDAHVKLGEVLCKTGRGSEGEESFSKAVETYQAACSLCDSANGDDLPGLLYDWGVGLNTIASHAKEGSVAEDLLEQAFRKLKDAASFDRGDAQPLNAIGDVLVALAERRLAAAASGSAAALPETVAAALEQAMAEGYSQALRISRSNTDALVGSAEVAALKAKLAREGERPDESRALSGEAAAAYGAALQQPTSLGSFSERCDIRYNCACQLALSGQEEAAATLLGALLAARGPQLQQELLEEDDLGPFRERGWFRQLVAAAAPPQQ